MIPEIDIDTFAERRDAGEAVIDVREADEYAEGHVPGAVFVPLSELADRIADVPEGPVLVICKSGARSRNVTEHLIGLGREATNVAGGTMAWITSGRDVVAGMERG